MTVKTDNFFLLIRIAKSKRFFSFKCLSLIPYRFFFEVSVFNSIQFFFFFFLRVKGFINTVGHATCVAGERMEQYNFSIEFDSVNHNLKWILRAWAL